MPSIPQLKRCSHCKQEKPRSEFYACKANRDGLRGQCKDCMYQLVREWKRTHPEQNAAQVRRYRDRRLASHREERANHIKNLKERPGKACTRCGQYKLREEYYTSNGRTVDGLLCHCKDCGREIARKWSKENRDRGTDNTRRWRANNPEKSRELTREQSRKWRRDNPDKKKAERKKRKALERGASDGTLTAEAWEDILYCYGNRCLCCGSTEEIQIDHIVPVTRGGAHSADNVQPLCRVCNRKKWTKTIDYRPLAVWMT